MLHMPLKTSIRHPNRLERDHRLKLFGKKSDANLVDSVKTESPVSVSFRPSKYEAVRNPGVPRILHKIPKSSPDSLILDYLESLGTPRALSVWLMYRSGEHKQLVEYSISAHDYLDRDIIRIPLKVSSFSQHCFSFNGITRLRLDYAASRFLSKCAGLKTSIDLKAVAIESAEKAEAQCKSTNQRLKMESRSEAVMPQIVAENFFRITSTIARILGPVPETFEDSGWSTGRTSSAYGDELTSVHKYCTRLDVTLSARRRASELLRGSPIWGAAVLNADGPVSLLSSALTTVTGNTMITVPKNAKTDRVICYEPHMNIRLQLSVGSYLKLRLSKAGINLRDQSINQRRALLASKTGHLATIDLSMASDTMCLELVHLLLPIDWALLLDDLRSKYTTWPDGSVRYNEKFSSMGNGFTFELESLLFYALACGVGSNVSVYGDDIIIPTSQFEDTKSVLDWAGFSLNVKKSFSEGNFRESCGTDGFCGVNVTPVYLRSIPKRTEDVIHLHNEIRSWCSRASTALLHYELMLSKWRNIHTHFHGPSGYGDGHYHVDFDRFAPRANDGLDGWWFKTSLRIFRSNSLYGDRVEGRFSSGFAWGALCASTGPKRSRDIVAATVDRRHWKYVSHRGLASFTWPSIDWF